MERFACGVNNEAVKRKTAVSEMLTAGVMKILVVYETGTQTFLFKIILILNTKS